MKRILLLLLFGLGITFSNAQTPITVDGTQTVQQLVEDVLVLGNCAEVNNVVSPNNSSVGGDAFESFGSFDGSAASPTFPFTSGIVLATNGIDMVPTGMPLQGGGFAWAGDPDLEALINEPGNTNNATVVEFDFIPFVEEISFNYLLASDEWPTFVCSFADTFAFILSGPGINDVNDYDHDANPNTPDLSLDLGGLNIALIPGTNIPVNPTNIHDLSNDCTPGDLGEFAVPQLYDGAANNDGTTFYNGRTVPLTASAQVIPGQTYSIKLAIADRSDTAFNSAVFIESASFDLGGIDLGPDITISNGNAPCEGEIVTLDAGFSASNIQYFWAQDGDIIPDENSQTLEVTEPGVYEVGIQIGSTGAACFGVSNAVTIEFFPIPEIDIAGSEILCGGETNTLDATPLNLNELDADNTTYSWTLDGAPVSGADGPLLDITESGVYEVTVANNDCVETASIEVELVVYTVEFAEDNIVICTEGNNTEVVLEPIVEGLTTAQQAQIFYNWSDGSNGETLTVTEGGTYSVEVDVNGSCVKSAEINVSITETIQVSVNDVLKCPGDPFTIQATLLSDTDPGVTYQWFDEAGNLIPDENGPTLTVENEGDYTVVVDNQGCLSDPAVASVSNYSVDNCTITQGLSPNDNNDGDNDCMDLTWLNDESGITKMSVFNRYGQLVFEEENYENTFCGQDRNGNDLVTGTYFYVIELERESERLQKGPVIKGWVYVNTEQQ